MQSCGTVAKMLGNPSEAEDIAQQVFLRLWKSRARYQPSAKFTTFLYTITRNLVFNETRRKSRRKESSLDQRKDDYELELPANPNQQPDREHLNAELQAAIDQAIEACQRNSASRSSSAATKICLTKKSPKSSTSPSQRSNRSFSAPGALSESHLRAI